ncbi:MAG: glucose-6-phosphate isomerase [Thermomicrobiales bacterium]|nr:glucose-6-phosphate isomerase [Thermomicrobiales bacterium]
MATAKSRLSIDYANVMASAVGQENGLTDAELNDAATQATAHIDRIWNEYDAGDQRWVALPDNRQLVADIESFASSEGRAYEDLILVGIGGSSLGAIATIQALAHPFRNLQPHSNRGGPRLFVLDNPDPEKVAATLETVDLSKTLVNVVTKSGQTAETMANFLVVKDALEQTVGQDQARKQIVATTDPKDGLLRQLADQEGYRDFPVPPGVDGRMTVLSAVGMLPAALCGVDIGGLLDGAAAMREASRNRDARQNPGALFASIAWLAATKRDKSMLVMMPYADSLFGIADWFRQLWAESLGKRLSTADDEVFAGQTPIKALGAIDQHSQIQLYTEGPNDKLICLTGVGTYRSGVEIAATPDSIDELGYLRNAELGQLLDRERMATAWALTNANRPNLSISIPAIDAGTVGEFFFMHEFQTVVGGGLFDVNPFGQPGVEAGKNATYALMGREGYETLRDELTGSGGESRYTLS